VIRRPRPTTTSKEQDVRFDQSRRLESGEGPTLICCLSDRANAPIPTVRATMTELPKSTKRPLRPIRDSGRCCPVSDILRSAWRDRKAAVPQSARQLPPLLFENGRNRPFGDEIGSNQMRDDEAERRAFFK
jgi:hypothetical protein